MLDQIRLKLIVNVSHGSHDTRGGTLQTLLTHTTDQAILKIPPLAKHGLDELFFFGKNTQFTYRDPSTYK
jgi:hypothetical protein